VLGKDLPGTKQQVSVVMRYCQEQRIVAAEDGIFLVFRDMEAYAKVSLKKYKPTAARNEDKNVPSGLL